MLTLAQLYDLGINAGIDIFGCISLPANSPINRTLLINSIMEHCGLNTPIYAEPNIMASAITLWSAKNQFTFEHIGKIIEADYNPIENTDKFETITVDHSRDNSRLLKDNTVGNNSKDETINNSSNTKSNGSGSEGHTGTDNTTTENTTSAFNSSTYQPADKTETSFTHGENVSTTNNETIDTTGNSKKNTKANLTNDKNVDEKISETEKTTTTTRLHGNIGVMSNQTMLTEEYELVGKFNPYIFISGLFENELTLFVY